MAYLSENLPIFKVLVRKEFLYNHEKGKGEFQEGICFGVTSITNRALGFHVMLDNGACYWRLPLHALCWRKTAKHTSIGDAQLWDNISYNITVTEYKFLKHKTACTKLRSGKLLQGEYMFTIDYAESSYAESADEHKCSHIIKLIDGNFTSLPNNRILWKDASFVNEIRVPDYKTNTFIYTCEDNLITEDSNRMFYEVKDE